MAAKTAEQKAQSYVSKLSPFKKKVGLLILSGMTPYDAAAKLSKESGNPVATYKSYATMVQDGLDKIFKTKTEKPKSTSKKIITVTNPKAKKETVKEKAEISSTSALSEFLTLAKNSGFSLEITLKPIDN